MAAKVVFSSLAIKELEESSDWYEGRSEGLGKRFVLLIRETIVIAAEHPEAFTKTKGPVRELIIDEFPYIIVYRYDKKEDTINILHIFHTSRNPKFKYRQK